MLFVIHAIDKPGTAALRQTHYDAHRAYINTAESFGVKIVMSGPLTSDDGKNVLGSHLVIEATDRATIEKFHHADPFHKAGLWQAPSILAFTKVVG